MHHPTDRITYTTAFVTPVVEHWLEPEIVRWVHPMKDRSDDPSHHEPTLLPRSYISLLDTSELTSSVMDFRVMSSDIFNTHLIIKFESKCVDLQVCKMYYGNYSLFSPKSTEHLM